MGKYKYTCKYCFKEYVPKRRGVQKYCSTTCRVKAYHSRNKNKSNLPAKSDSGLSKSAVGKQNEKTSIDKMSPAGVANAAAGYAGVEVLKTIFTPEHQKSATKGDIQRLEAKLVQRYHEVKNMPPNAYGMKPYFDLVKGKVEYRL